MTMTPRDTPEGLLADAMQCWESFRSIYQHDATIPVPRALLDKWLVDFQPVLELLRASPDPPGPAATFGQRVRAARKRLGLSQGAAAQLVGVAHQLLSHIELDSRGASKAALVRQLAQGLGCRADYLVGLTQASPVPSTTKQRKAKTSSTSKAQDEDTVVRGTRTDEPAPTCMLLEEGSGGTSRPQQ